MLIYLLKSSGCLLVLMLFYKLILERESIHQFKRFYLLGSLVAAFLIPLVTWTTYVEIPLEPEGVPFDPTLLPMEDMPSEEPFNWAFYLGVIYGSGVLFFGLRFIKNLWSLHLKIKRNQKIPREAYIQVLILESIVPHTFLKYVFVEKSQFDSKNIPDEILLHEQIHVEQKHTLDILLVEVMQILLWFHPLIYLIKKDIKLNHEFLADQAVLSHGFETKNYQNILLDYSISSSHNQLVSSINYSLIKKRLTVMKTHTSKQVKWLKSLVLLPFLALLIYSFSSRKEVFHSNLIQNQLTIENKKSDIELQVDETGKLYYQSKEITIEELSQITNIEDHIQIKLVFPESRPEKTIKKVNKQITDFIRSKDVKHFSICSSFMENDQKTSNTVIRNLDIPELQVEQNPTRLILNGKSTNFDKLLDDFKQITNNQKSDLYINTKGENLRYDVLMQIANSLRNQFGEITVSDGVIRDPNNSSLTKNPNGSVSIHSLQEGASKAQIAEYNKLAKKYNSQPKEEQRFYKKDVERLGYLYGLMTKEQKAHAEPFPNIPPPPPTPPVEMGTMSPELQKLYKHYTKEADAYVKAVSVYRKTKKGTQEDLKNQYSDLMKLYKTYYELAYKEKLTPVLPPPPPPAPEAPEVIEVIEVEGYSKSKVKKAPKTADLQEKEVIGYPSPESRKKSAAIYAKENPEKVSKRKTNSGEVIEIVEVPVNKLDTNTPKTAYDFVKSHKNDDITYYYNDKKVTYDEILKIVKKEPNININTNITDHKGTVKFWSKK
ncbi:M56 family metallopeptidase [Mangrovimonas sp. AS39]|uniref:M56 family metallopeptidase n=1 Tax=Mangrovimonas futianensis TaxID=2895523 RepID=UPI001E4D63AA|nr:M56 family metallopeptidase [Mangrovimonas futianensis]MCF1190949.1 M56 family metallopeptidase [Mangrovimonas futianensis]MCF1194645.1 M56 family metallopeptidase [Mangrovimonas futianensis]